MWNDLEFKKKSCFTKKDDRLPDMFYKEPLPPLNKIVVDSEQEIESTFVDLKKKDH